MELVTGSPPWGSRGLITARARAASWLVPATVGTLTMVALGLRLAGLHASLTGDELFAYDDVHGRSLAGVIHAVGHGAESSPPLFFILAWAAAHLGDPATLIRLPSILSGAAAVPVVYLLGARTLGRMAGLLGAGLLALNPLAVYQGSEGRPYELLIFCAALSALLLVRALEAEREWSWWWVGYALATVAVVYTHYTGVFVLAGQSVWALWAGPTRRRPLVAASALALVLYLPWLPDYHGWYLAVYNVLGVPVAPGPIVRMLLQSLIGHPAFGSLGAFPGRWLEILWLIAVPVCAAVAWGRFSTGALARMRSERMARALGFAPGGRRGPSPQARAALVGVLALATPAGLIIYSLVSYNLLLVHNLVASLPFALLAVGGLLAAALRRAPLAGGAGALIVLAVAGVGAARTVAPGNQRADYRDALAFVNARARSGDTLIDGSLFPVAPGYQALVPAYLSGTYRVAPSGSPVATRAWAAAVRGRGAVFVLVTRAGILSRYQLPRWAGTRVACILVRSGPAPPGCARLRASRTFDGLQQIVVGEYSGR
jgi:hypothetical protein